MKGSSTRFTPLMATLVFVALAGCDTPAAPGAPRMPVAPAMDVVSNPVLTVQLRTLPGFATVAWGHLELRLIPTDPCVPPNPTVPAGNTLVAVCGQIFNEGGAVFSRGGIYTVPGFDEEPLLLASFGGIASPVDPCRRYDLRGYVVVPSVTADALVTSPGNFQVLLAGTAPDNTQTAIGGLLDGLAWGPVGVKSEQDVFFGSNVCSIAIAP